MKNTLLLIVMLLGAVGLKAQTPDNFERFLMKTNDGFKIIYNGNSQSIIVDIVSTDINPIENSDLINVNQDPIQFNLISNSAFSTTDSTVERQKAELLGYSEYELNYIKDELKLKISDIHKEWVTINKKLFLLWHFNMPPDNKSISQQVYLTTLCFAHAFNISSPVSTGQNFADKKRKLTTLAQTLKLNSFKTDLAALAKQLQAENK
ncbi:hypothetical protein ACFFGT_07650 [Mucilaginibacter angelicae]|uniref:DUF4468 domain-containing protein n=1 Tax=Mucilaginibacter angelicae TaxID=869718 RepID=A0ABV6L3P2_9SPHI